MQKDMAKSKKKVIDIENHGKEAKNNITNNYNADDLIFALDIGTRSVVGIVGIMENNTFKVISTEVIEHKNRSMLDGQIHDIVQVSEVVKEIKTRLENNIGIVLSKVAIAAAGRVLKTSNIKVERQIDKEKEIDHDLVSSMEIEGVQLAQMKLDDETVNEEKTQFYCVGYSVINYYLNGYIISTLIGHKGRTISADILATFLPYSVVDSLYTVMRKVGLDVAGLTLEPIAAIHVTIPKELQLLNLALVDIGAGTSDIAITRDGSVVAYGMVPIAGDEITEKISQHYLVDFNTGERIKRMLSSKKDRIDFTDILGKKHRADAAEVYNIIKPSIEHLAEVISNKILEFNHRSPNAVFLIGGGSQIPGISETIASCLKLPEDRVAVRGRDIIKNIKFNSRKLTGPEAITPFGIALTAVKHKDRDFLMVTVNDKKVRLLNTKKLSVSDALILVGFNPAELIGRRGKSLSFKINGIKKVIKGEYGKAAEIFVNEKPANLETLLSFGDSINIIPAQNGKDAQVKVSDIIESFSSGKGLVDGIIMDEGTTVCINSVSVSFDAEIYEGDNVEICTPETIHHEEPEKLEAECVNDDNSISIVANGKEALLSGKSTYMFIDVFNYINFDISKPQGRIVLKLNGKEAGFTDGIKSGDSVEIYWEK